ncbi:hypothetical protein HanIR_Chr17g0885531 [Helianthus annuus]|nr:hypothetical protein HanIR_Chr17g0885531 [Helianthus annuus]
MYIIKIKLPAVIYRNFCSRFCQMSIIPDSGLASQMMKTLLLKLLILCLIT